MYLTLIKISTGICIVVQNLRCLYCLNVCRPIFLLAFSSPMTIYKKKNDLKKKKTDRFQSLNMLCNQSE